MEIAAKGAGGLACLALGLACLYRPAWVLRANELARRFLLSDALFLAARRRLGLLLFLLGTALLYSSYINFLAQRRAPPADLTEGYRAFRAGRFGDSETIARRALKEDPGNPHADFLQDVSAKARPRRRP